MKLDLAQLHGPFLRGDLVQTWFSDSGSAMPGYVYGVVTQAGPRRIGVLWESGRRNSLHRTRWHTIALVPETMVDEARKATRRVREELLATQTRERLGNL